MAMVGIELVDGHEGTVVSGTYVALDSSRTSRRNEMTWELYPLEFSIVIRGRSWNLRRCANEDAYLEKYVGDTG